MSEPRSSNVANSAWLKVQIDHHFQHGPAAFHLQVAFEARAARTVIFGPSGSGKSSVLRSIAGLLDPDSGRIQIRGETVWEKTARRLQGANSVPVEKRRVGLVMQTPAVFPHLTVAGNVGFPLRKMEKQIRERTVSELLAMVQAEQLIDRWPRELSGGQLQRVAIARMLAAEPTVLLLDEPFAALDARNRSELSENVHRWAREQGVPVLTVTHDLEEAFAAGEEVLAMKEGRIVAQGGPHRVLAEERQRLLLAMGAVAANQVRETESGA